MGAGGTAAEKTARIIKSRLFFAFLEGWRSCCDKNNVVSHIQPGGVLEKELQYQGGSLEEIAAQIQQDENALLEYMTTGDDMGQKSFVFAGFMFRKDMIDAAQMTEPEF